jgi:hypothetical protein
MCEPVNLTGKETLKILVLFHAYKYLVALLLSGDNLGNNHYTRI